MGLRPALALVGLLGLGPAVEAGEAGRDVLVLSLAASADLASTRYALQACPSCREGNPLAEQAGPVAVKLVGTAAALVICHELRQHGHPRAAKWFRWGVVILWGGVAAHNLHTARSTR